jgi:hypothetical protein
LTVPTARAHPPSWKSRYSSPLSTISAAFCSTPIPPLPKLHTSLEEVFRLGESREVDAYKRIALLGHRIQMPSVPPREEVATHMIPDVIEQVMELGLWWNDKSVNFLSLPLQGFSVHFLGEECPFFDRS